MKNFTTLILTLFITFSLFSQSKIEQEAEAFFWGKNDRYKNKNTIPEKWKNESAVIIYKNENYDFHKFGKRITYKTSIRKRIKLLDKASVDEFSEFSYVKRFRSNKGRYTWRSKGDNVVGVKIIKPDGKEIKIDVNNDAIKVDGEEKIAISNLEVGDIIDYYFYKIEPFKSEYPFGFDPVETTLAEEYPIIDYRLSLESENDFFINFKTLNDSPKLVEVKTDKRNQRHYKLEASNIEKRSFTRWSYPLLSLAAYKFQVYFARTIISEKKALAFLPKKEDIIKTDVSKEEVLELYKKRFTPEGKTGDIKRFLKGKNFKNDAEKVTQAYYYMRHYYLTRYFEAIYARESNIIYYPFSYYKSNAVYIDNDKKFIRHFTEFLKRNKIGYDIVIAKNKFDGTIDELLIEKNVNVLLKVNTKTPLYVSIFDLYSEVNVFSSELEGTDTFLLTTEKGKINGIKKGNLPASVYNDNFGKKEITLNFEDTFSKINITSKSSYKGHVKRLEQKQKLTITDYAKEDYKIYKTKTLVDRVGLKKDKARYKKELASLMLKIKEKQKERFEKSIKSEYEFDNIEDYDYNIINTGRFGLNDLFIHTESYTIGNSLIKKAGPNYILEIGKFIGGQINLSDDEKTRTEDIYLNYPKKYEYTITLIIPSGYTISGLDKLNKSVDNITGNFISNAKIEGNKLIVTTKKTYKNIYQPNSNWKLMQHFLDAALQFTNEKILLKKQ